MDISASCVKQLRDETGAGFMECKKALQETNGDMEKAKEVLKEKGLAKAEKKAGRAASQGLIHSYIHGEGKLGVLVEVNCETDFVARTDDFKELVHEIALQIAGMAPEYVSIEDVPADVLEQEKELYRKQAENEGKPAEIIDKIVEGKVQNFYKTKVLLEQPYVRDDSKVVKDLIKEKIALIGENIVVRRFVRWTLGE
ncbi:translation elongation factor Ts [Coprothermobacter platensis]|uniref:translation elongation factor Ts n=1 Tax=Coprothermobacter platensis TaxID=108819 RepID=UPI00037B5327|nr:translation elongation factor Ts [Coprothermobacter platensis]